MKNSVRSQQTALLPTSKSRATVERVAKDSGNELTTHTHAAHASTRACDGGALGSAGSDCGWASTIGEQTAYCYLLPKRQLTAKPWVKARRKA